MQRTSKIALNSGFIPAKACGLQDDVILLCLALSMRLRRRNLLVALVQYTVTHFWSSLWFLSSLLVKLDHFSCLARDQKSPSQRRIVANICSKEVDLH